MARLWLAALVMLGSGWWLMLGARAAAEQGLHSEATAQLYLVSDLMVALGCLGLIARGFYHLGAATERRLGSVIRPGRRPLERAKKRASD